MKMDEKIKLIKNYFKHKTKKNVLRRFLIILIISLIYFSFAIGHHGLSNGILVTFLTWSLFVLCTPIADAGFLLDFPIRLFTKIRMIYSEIVVWIIAISLNIFTLSFYPLIYEKTFLLKLFKIILTTPFPYWFIIIISMLGTFLSIYFGDELLDVVEYKERKKHQKHKNKYLLLVIFFIIVLLILIYYYLLNDLGIKI